MALTPMLDKKDGTCYGGTLGAYLQSRCFLAGGSEALRLLQHWGKPEMA
jgi:hypothetical protein